MELWRHGPILSSEPKELLEFLREEEKDGSFSEKGVFLLENNKYLYIRYVGMLDNPDTGITDIEEFDTLENAMELYNE